MKPPVHREPGECSCCDQAREYLEDLGRSGESRAALQFRAEAAEARAEILHEEIQESDATKAAKDFQKCLAGRAWAVIIAEGHPQSLADTIRDDLLRMEI